LHLDRQGRKVTSCPVEIVLYLLKINIFVRLVSGCGLSTCPKSQALPKRTPQRSDEEASTVPLAESAGSQRHFVV
jgi:hypothetical protein